MFFEPSTRTQCSFVGAMLRLGGTVLPFDIGSSSIKKGESLEGKIQRNRQHRIDSFLLSFSYHLLQIQSV